MLDLPAASCVVRTAKHWRLWLSVTSSMVNYRLGRWVAFGNQFYGSVKCVLEVMVSSCRACGRELSISGRNVGILSPRITCCKKKYAKEHIVDCSHRRDPIIWLWCAGLLLMAYRHSCWGSLFSRRSACRQLERRVPTASDDTSLSTFAFTIYSAIIRLVVFTSLVHAVQPKFFLQWGCATLHNVY